MPDARLRGVNSRGIGQNQPWVIFDNFLALRMAEVEQSRLLGLSLAI
jgi:hypothetical protein